MLGSGPLTSICPSKPLMLSVPPPDNVILGWAPLTKTAPVNALTPKAEFGADPVVKMPPVNAFTPKAAFGARPVTSTRPEGVKTPMAASGPGALMRILPVCPDTLISPPDNMILGWAPVMKILPAGALTPRAAFGARPATLIKPLPDTPIAEAGEGPLIRIFPVGAATPRAAFGAGPVTLTEPEGAAIPRAAKGCGAVTRILPVCPLTFMLLALCLYAIARTPQAVKPVIVQTTAPDPDVLHQ